MKELSLKKDKWSHFFVHLLPVSDHLKLKKNITYIVCGVIFRKVNGIIEVLMMQEVRPDCNGAWYLPAGRLEPNETLEVT